MHTLGIRTGRLQGAWWPSRLQSLESARMNEPGIDAVRRIAALARLEVGEAEARELADKFERILGQFQVLARLDVAGVEESAGPPHSADQRRADLPRPSLGLEQVLAQAPARVEGFYRVPKTVGGEE